MWSFPGKIFKDLVKKETESGEDEIKPKLRRKPTELDSDDDEDTVDDVKPLKQVCIEMTDSFKFSNSNVGNPIIFPSLELFNICWIIGSQEAKASVQPPPHIAPEVIAVLRINEHELGLRKLYQHKRLTSCASQVSFTDLVRNQKGDLLFVQLPDVLPGQVGEKCLSNLISDAGCEKRGWWVWLRHGLSWGGDHQLPINIKCQMSHYEMLHTCL